MEDQEEEEEEEEEERRNSISVNFDLRRSFGSSFKSSVKETFFPDDPFRRFRSGDHTTTSSCLRKTKNVVEYLIPVVEWLPEYDLSKFRYDLLAGATIASLAIPQGISYARLANLPPVVGLYSSFVPPLIYAILGSSKNVAIGTIATASILLASIIGEEVSAVDNPDLYLHLVFTSAFFSGIFQSGLGFFRLGMLVDFLSRATIVGFMAGTAIIITLQQLKGLLGLKNFTTKTDVVSVLRSVFTQTDKWSWQSALFGIFLMSLLFLTRYLKIRKPKLFWVSAISPLLVVVFGGLFAFLIHADNHGIPTVGPLRKGLNPLSVGDLIFDSKYLMTAVKAGMITGFISLAEGIAVGRSLAMENNEDIDGNKEMIAFGLMNIAGSFTSCYLTTAPFSKSAVNYNAGCKTAMSNIVMAMCIMLVLLFLAPLFRYTPLVALAAIIIVAMVGLIHYDEALEIFKTDKFDFLICISAFLGVAFISMDVGILISVSLGVVRTLLYVARPSTCKLGKLQETSLYRDVEQYPCGNSTGGILVLQVGSPIFFPSASYLRERIMRWVEEESMNEDKQYLILDIGGVTSIDNTGLEMMYELWMNLRKKNIKMVLTDPRIEVMEKMMMSKLMGSVGRQWVFLSVEEAVSACQFSLSKVDLNGNLRLKQHKMQQ